MTTSNKWLKMRLKHSWKDTERGKGKFSEQNEHRCNFFQHKCRVSSNTTVTYLPINCHVSSNKMSSIFQQNVKYLLIKLSRIFQQNVKYLLIKLSRIFQHKCHASSKTTVKYLPTHVTYLPTKCQVSSNKTVTYLPINCHVSSNTNVTYLPTQMSRLLKIVSHILVLVPDRRRTNVTLTQKLPSKIRFAKVKVTGRSGRAV